MKLPVVVLVVDANGSKSVNKSIFWLYVKSRADCGLFWLSTGFMGLRLGVCGRGGAGLGGGALRFCFISFTCFLVRWDWENKKSKIKTNRNYNRTYNICTERIEFIGKGIIETACRLHRAQCKRIVLGRMLHFERIKWIKQVCLLLCRQ